MIGSIFEFGIIRLSRQVQGNAKQPTKTKDGNTNSITPTTSLLHDKHALKTAGYSEMIWRKLNRAILKCIVVLVILDLFTFHALVQSSGRHLSDGTVEMVVSNKAKPITSSGSFDLDKMTMDEIIRMYSRSSFQHPPFPALKDSVISNDATTSQQSNGDGTVDHTLQVLQDLGISESIIDSEGFTGKLPSWRQIIDNYGDKPIILGKERCQAYRETVLPSKRVVGLAGLFSSGTNVMHHLLLNNCEPPNGGQKPQKTFQWQVPWYVSSTIGTMMMD